MKNEHLYTFTAPNSGNAEPHDEDKILHAQ